MKSKTSITLSEDVLAGIDRLAGRRYSRSELIDAVLRQYLHERDRTRRDEEEIQKINRYARELNQEAEDVARYQTLPPFEEEE